MSDQFWDKVIKCDHKNHTKHYDFGSCPTPYCSWDEIRCADCGVYITKCGCHWWDGMSGWPQKRHRKLGMKIR